MKHIISIFLLFVIALATCRELKTEKSENSEVRDSKLTNVVITEAVPGVSNIPDLAQIHKLKVLKKRSPGKRSRERHGYYYGGRSRGGRSRGGRSRGGRSRGGRSRGGHSRHGGHSRYGGHSRHGGNSQYGGHSGGGRSYQSYYGNSRYNYGQGGHVPYRGSRYPTYGSRYIGVIRYGSRPVNTNSISGNQRPISGNCNCPFSQNNEPSVESDEYDFDYLRQWQRAFSSHPCCRQRWEVYWSNSQRK